MDPFKQYFDKLIWFFVNKTLFSKLVNKSGSPINPATEDLQKEILNTLKGTEHLNPSDVSNPIVSAQNRTTKAVEELIIPEVDLKGLESKMDEFLRVLREKDLSVTVGKTEVNVDSKSIVSAIEKMTKNLPKMKESEIIDYVEFKQEEKRKSILAVYEEDDIKVIVGRWGPYIKQGTENYKIPKDKHEHAADISLDELKEMIAHGIANPPKGRFAKKKAATKAPAKKAATKKSAPKKAATKKAPKKTSKD